MKSLISVLVVLACLVGCDTVTQKELNERFKKENDNLDGKFTNLGNEISKLVTAVDATNKKVGTFDNRLNQLDKLLQQRATAPAVPKPEEAQGDLWAKRLNEETACIVRQDAAIKANNAAIAGLKSTLCGNDDRYVEAINQHDRRLGGIERNQWVLAQQQEALRTEQVRLGTTVGDNVKAQVSTDASLRQLSGDVNRLNNKKADSAPQTINMSVVVPGQQPITPIRILVPQPQGCQ